MTTLKINEITPRKFLIHEAKMLFTQRGVFTTDFSKLLSENVSRIPKMTRSKVAQTIHIKQTKVVYASNITPKNSSILLITLR